MNIATLKSKMNTAAVSVGYKSFLINFHSNINLLKQTEYPVLWINLVDTEFVFSVRGADESVTPITFYAHGLVSGNATEAQNIAAWDTEITRFKSFLDALNASNDFSVNSLSFNARLFDAGQVKENAISIVFPSVDVSVFC